MENYIDVKVPDVEIGDYDYAEKNIKKRKMTGQDKPRVLRSRMSDRLSALPNEILCYILSFLTIRDSVRTRVLSARWRYLSDYRSVLHFDALNVLGSAKTYCESYQSKFVRAADQVLEVWKVGRNINALRLQFCLGKNQASHIDMWVTSCIRMEIEDMELSFSSEVNHDKMYVLSDDLLHCAKPFYLKCLRLKYCALTWTSGCTNWISHLVTLELVAVCLDEKEVKCILSGGLNLKSLRLGYCCYPKYSSINVELPRLKELRLSDFFEGVELNCPNLETLVCSGRADHFKFSHAPFLTKVNLMLKLQSRGYASTFESLARHAPKLQTLSLKVMTEVQPSLANNFMPCLKRLELQTDVPTGFDLLSITHLLKASPFLEILHLELSFRDYAKQSPQREYLDWPHFELKEVKMDGFILMWAGMELAQFFLKNAVALQRMIIVDQSRRESSCRDEMATSLLQGIKTSAELVILC